MRNGAARGTELGLLPTGGDDEGNGAVLASGWGKKGGSEMACRKRKMRAEEK